ncbi:transmembrane transporter [Aureococcus anophagefferens]|nr:transmembrane transporter [Aureococcus anophagefferens]
MSAERPWRVYAACVLVQLNFAVGAVVAALGLPLIHPMCFALIREASAAALLLLWARGTTTPRERRVAADWRVLCRVGACAAATQLLALVGLKLSSNPTVFALYQPAQPARRRGVRAPPLGGFRRDARRWRIHRLRRLRARGLRDARRPRGRPVVVAAASYALAACCTAAAAAGLAAAPGDVGAWLCPDCDGFWRVPAALPALLWWIFMSTVLNYALMLWAVAASSPTLVTAFSALQPVAAAGVTLAVLASRPRFRCRGAADARCLRPPAASDGPPRRSSSPASPRRPHGAPRDAAAARTTSASNSRR